MPNEKFDLSLVKMGLEHASFTNFRVREEILNILKSIELDLEDVGFEPSDNTKEVLERFESFLTDIEAPRIFKESPLRLDESEIENVKEIPHNIEDDIVKLLPDDEDYVKPRRIVNVDEELDNA